MISMKIDKTSSCADFIQWYGVYLLMIALWSVILNVDYKICLISRSYRRRAWTRMKDEYKVWNSNDGDKRCHFGPIKHNYAWATLRRQAKVIGTQLVKVEKLILDAPEFYERSTCHRLKNIKRANGYWISRYLISLIHSVFIQKIDVRHIVSV